MTDMGLVETLPSDPVAALSRISSLKSEVDSLEHQSVARAREAGVSWQEIADALGVSRQAAWERFTRSAREAMAATAQANADLSDDEAMQIAVAEVKAVRGRRRG